MSKTRYAKPAPIEFPPVPEHPRINPRLEYVLSGLRVLDRTVTCMETAQQSLATSAWRDAMSDLHTMILTKARESIEDLGPLASASQKAELREFIKSLETDPPKEAA